MAMRNVLTNWKWGLSVLFGIAVALFWGLPYLSVLSFQEQYQLFLFGSDYFHERMAVPGGMADYLGEFLTQFYYVPVVGTIILAVLYVALQRMVWALARRNGASDTAYPFSFIPSLMLWVHMGDENVLLSFVIALLAAVGTMLCYHAASHEGVYPSRKWQKTAFFVVGFPLVYWLFGPCMLMVPLYALVYECVRGRKVARADFGVVAVAYSVAVVFFCCYHLQYPLRSLFVGINYYRYPIYQPVLQTAIQLVATLLPFVMALLPAMRKAALAVALQVAVLVGVGGFFVVHAFDPLKYDLIEYDFLVRTNQWGRIIAKAEKKQPSRPFDVACVNLALAMRGQLSDRLFEFFQHGAEGLFPAFQRDMTTPLPSCETFYRLGMVNDAERYAFEAQEAIPNHRKSGRLTKRITECNIINGHYGVALKYLRMLQKSWFYAKWAREQETMVRAGKVTDDPVYRQARAFRQKKHDFLFSDTEMDQMLGLLFVQNYDNRMAFEYLMCYELLQRDLDRFNQYYPLGKYAKFNRIPTAYQQALVMQWTQEHGSYDGMPWSIEPATCNLLNQFVGLYMRNPKDPALLQPPLGNTFWSYMLVSQEGKDKMGKQQMKEIY